MPVVVTPRGVRALLVVVVGLAAALTLAGVPMATAQGTTVFVARVDDGLPVDDAFAAAWDRAVATDVPLSGQAVTAPRLLDPTVSSVRVRGLTDDRRLAILIEWSDATEDASVLRSDAFADAVAMQFALGDGISICMGQQAGAINIWHWKADWAADLAAWRDVDDANPNMPVDLAPADPSQRPNFVAGREAGNLRSASTRSSSVEEVDAVGFGTLTSQPLERQAVHGASAYRDGTWRVVMSRALTDDDPNDVQIDTARSISVAFAVWDGSNGDRDGLKSTSSWLSLGVIPRPVGLLDGWPFLAMILLVLGLIAWMLYIGLREPAIGVGWPPGGPQRDPERLSAALREAGPSGEGPASAGDPPPRVGR